MRSLLLLSILVISVSSKENVAVYPLSGVGLDASTLTILTDKLQTELVEIGTYNIIGRYVDLGYIVSEQSLQQNGLFSDSTIAELGNITGASYIIGGRIHTNGYTYTIAVNMYNVSNGEIVESVGAVYDNEHSMLKYGMEHVAHDLTGNPIRFKQDDSFGSSKAKLITMLVSGAIGITTLSMSIHYKSEAEEYKILHNVYNYYGTNDYSSEIAYNEKMARIMVGISGGSFLVFGVSLLF